MTSNEVSQEQQLTNPLSHKPQRGYFQNQVQPIGNFWDATFLGHMIHSYHSPTTGFITERWFFFWHNIGTNRVELTYFHLGVKRQHKDTGLKHASCITSYEDMLQKYTCGFTYLTLLLCNYSGRDV